MSDNSNDLGAFLAGFVIGGLVGAATALILAPQSGEDTRGQIAVKSRELRDASEERVQHYRQVAESYGQEYRDKAGQAVEDTRSRVQEASGHVQEQARIVLDSGKERVAQVRDQVDSNLLRDEEHAEAEGDEGVEAST